MGVDCGSQVCICDMPIRIDTYNGCSHLCKYCFVKKKKDISVVKADNCIQSLKDFISGKRTRMTAWCDWDIPLHWGGMSDPFQPCEAEHRISYEALKVFAETKYPFVVSTKGRLVAEQEYLDLLAQCNCVVQISMVCDEYDIMESGAPSYKERLDMCKKLSKVVKRLIVRIQPYMTEVKKSVIRNLDKLKEAGVYGVTIEGMKFTRPQKGLIRLGNDFVYPVGVLERDFNEIRKECERLGLAFYCAENRLRSMGQSMTCCGCDNLDGFVTNSFNLEHILNGDKVEPTEKMKEIGTAAPFVSIMQFAGCYDIARKHSFSDFMTDIKTVKGYEPVILATDERRKIKKGASKK